MPAPSVIDPISRLALHMVARPGRYAVLLGSGLSRAAGIPSGWEITIALARSIAVAQGAATLGEEASVEAWFLNRFGVPLSYPHVLGALAKDGVTERDLLARFFRKPTTIDDDTNAIEPTVAHDAIALLMARKFIHVAVTTNFDDLLERALHRQGISDFRVISNESEAAAGRSWSADHCLILKPHGDWRRGEIRNAPEQVNHLPGALRRLLASIFEEHALIVAGWSASDEGVRRVLLRRLAKRLPTFWIVRDSPSELVAQTVSLSDGEMIPGDLQTVLPRVLESVDAVASLTVSDPITSAVAVARAKRYLDAGAKTQLDDLITANVFQLCEWVTNESSLNPWTLDVLGPLGKRRAFRKVLEVCEANTKPAIALLITLARYAEDADDEGRVAGTVVARVMMAAQRRANTEGEWPFMAEYPALLVAFAFGIGCCYRKQWKRAVVPLSVGTSGGLNDDRTLFAIQWKEFEKRLNDVTLFSRAWTLSARIRDQLRPEFRDWIPRDTDFQLAADQFDMLFSMSGEARVMGSGDAWVGMGMRPLSEGSGAAMAAHVKRFERQFHDWIGPAMRWAKNPDSAPEEGRDLALAITSEHLGNMTAYAQHLWERSPVVEGRGFSTASLPHGAGW